MFSGVLLFLREQLFPPKFTLFLLLFFAPSDYNRNPQSPRRFPDVRDPPPPEPTPYLHLPLRGDGELWSC